MNNTIVPPNSNNINTDISIRFASHTARILTQHFVTQCFFRRLEVESGDTLLSDVSTTGQSTPVKLFAQDVPRADVSPQTNQNDLKRLDSLSVPQKAPRKKLSRTEKTTPVIDSDDDDLFAFSSQMF